MNTEHSKYLSYFLPVAICIFFIAFLSSCIVENNLARNFLKERKSINIFLLKPEYLFKTNLKEDSIAALKDLSDEKKDSIGIARSVFLKDIKDTVVINNYFQSTIDELKAYGLNVVTDTLNISQYPNLYSFNISQLELDEEILPYEDKIVIDTSWYVQTFDLNAVALDTWIEVRKPEAESQESNVKVLYAEHTANDLIKGSFQRDILVRKVNYRYKRNDLTVSDIYDLASWSGRKNADYLFDYLMNQNINMQLKNLNKPQSSVYFHYNRYYNYLTPAEGDRITVLK